MNWCVASLCKVNDNIWDSTLGFSYETVTHLLTVHVPTSFRKTYSPDEVSPFGTRLVERVPLSALRDTFGECLQSECVRTSFCKPVHYVSHNSRLRQTKQGGWVPEIKQEMVFSEGGDVFNEGVTMYEGKCQVKAATTPFKPQEPHRCLLDAPYVSAMCLLSHFLSGDEIRGSHPLTEAQEDAGVISRLLLFRLRPGEIPEKVLSIKKTDPAYRLRWAKEGNAAGRMLVTAKCYVGGRTLSVHDTTSAHETYPTKENFWRRNWAPGFGSREQKKLEATEDYNTVAERFSDFFIALRGPLLLWTPLDNKVSIVELTLAAGRKDT